LDIFPKYPKEKFTMTDQKLIDDVKQSLSTGRKPDPAQAEWEVGLVTDALAGHFPPSQSHALACMLLRLQDRAINTYDEDVAVRAVRLIGAAATTAADAWWAVRQLAIVAEWSFNGGAQAQAIREASDVFTRYPTLAFPNYRQFWDIQPVGGASEAPLRVKFGRAWQTPETPIDAALRDMAKTVVAAGKKLRPAAAPK
jgi:hypothetical protein